MPTLLVIDDEPERTEQIADWFGTMQYEVIRAHSGQEGLERARDLQPDIIILDIRMPGMDGHEVLLRLRRDPDTEGIPVVICSVEGNEPDGLQELTRQGLQEGADYVAAEKWSLRALEEVVKRTLSPARQLPVIRVGLHELKLGEGCSEVWVNDVHKRLTPLEAGVLAHLNQRRGKSQKVAEIEESVWPDEQEAVSGEARVRRVIERLRHKIEPNPSEPIFIVVKPGFGYMLVESSKRST